MSESKHTPEPWEFGYGQTREFGMCLGIGLNSAPDWHVVAVVSPADSVNHADEANARRIVACVNACAGFSTETLELIASVGGMQHKMTATAAVASQRDELLAALERFMDSHEECTDFGGFTARIVSMGDYHKLMEAVARAKGEQ